MFYNISFIERMLSGKYFTDPNKQSIVHFLSFVIPSIPAFSKIFLS